MINGPEPCFSSFATGRCYSPVACASFGYCRDRNLLHGVPANEEAAAAWRLEAEQRKAGSVLSNNKGTEA